jgi:formate dehydrogenase maturation protein FdhE
MATETELLIWGYKRLETEIQARLKEIETLREMQKQTKEKMPRLYYIQGFGQQGLAARIHFAGSFDDCKVWVSHNEQLELTEDEQQIRRKDVPQVGSYPVAGMIASVTPVDKGWREISDMAELDNRKGGSDAVQD